MWHSVPSFDLAWIQYIVYFYICFCFLIGQQWLINYTSPLCYFHDVKYVSFYEMTHNINLFNCPLIFNHKCKIDICQYIGKIFQNESEANREEYWQLTLEFTYIMITLIKMV
jgi:hypothetical protein